MFPCLVVSAFSGRRGLRDCFVRVLCPTTRILKTRTLSPRTSGYSLNSFSYEILVKRLNYQVKKVSICSNCLSEPSGDVTWVSSVVPSGGHSLQLQLLQQSCAKLFYWRLFYVRSNARPEPCRDRPYRRTRFRTHSRLRTTRRPCYLRVA